MSNVFIISAPSGSGKSTLVNRLLAADRKLLFSVSYTTRAPRGNEVPGSNYVYIGREEFEKRIENNEFLEWAQVFGNYYGTHSSILDQGRNEGKDIVLDIDVQGARQLRERIPGAISIFILAPSREELAHRLRSRSEDAEEVIQRRLNGAAAEIRDWRQYDYVLVNEDVDKASELLLSIVKAARLKRDNPGVVERVERILKSFE
jgi:guanylate kinase